MHLNYIDLFCGIGGFRVAANQVFERHNIESRCVFSSDIDDDARRVYYSNFRDYPAGDIRQVKIDTVPDHDILFAGFPCQPFSIIGSGKGFDDARGTLFFEIARILKAKRPKAFVLENVKMLAGHNTGKTLSAIVSVLRDLDYHIDYRILNALHYGVPQKRERIFIVGFHQPMQFVWPARVEKFTPLNEILEIDVDVKHFTSNAIHEKRLKSHHPAITPSIWHENKAGNISSYPYSCALRAGASYNYLLVDGKRRLTPREMFRLQGFPDSFQLSSSDSQARKQAGNSVAVPVVKAVIESFLPILMADQFEAFVKHVVLKRTA